jgi:hypothetical protein
MTTARKIKSNRTNAQASTGPKTARGKARAVQNACRHGLSVPVFSDFELSEQVESLAREIAGEGSDDEIYHHARRIAEAEIDLLRIRRARDDCLIRNINDPDYISAHTAKRDCALLCKFIREHGAEVPVPPELMSLIETRPQGAEKALLVLSDFSKKLNKIDRYERRALSRRKFAIRAFDFARRKPSQFNDAPTTQTVQSG